MNNRSASTGNSNKNKWAGFGLVLISVFVCFAPDLKNGLLDWDDSGYIYNNLNIRSLSIDTVIWAFTDFYCNYWAPLTWLSLALDYAVWGSNPVGYHLTNNLIHALNAAMFFLISHHLLTTYAKDKFHETCLDSRAILVTSLIASLFFGIHPLRVESVAWATERKDVLSVFWGLGSLLLYFRYVRESVAHHRNPSFYTYPSYWIMLFVYALSLLSKSMLITLPFVLLVLDWFPLQRLKKNRIAPLILEKMPLLILAIGASLITMRALAVTSKSLAEINLSTRILTACKALIQYLQLVVYPMNISPVYFHPGNVTLDISYVLSMAALAVISAACILSLKRHPLYLTVWLIFLITILPVLGLTQNGPQELAPRFTYIPTLSLSLLIALGITTLWHRVPVLKSRLMLLAIFMVFLLATLEALVIRDIGHWKNDIALWTRVIELQPHRFGKAYYQRSLFYFRAKMYEEALADAEEALAIAKRKSYPGIHENYAHRGDILSKMGRHTEALEDFTKAIELSGEPFTASYYYERAAIHRSAGNFKAAEEDLAEATKRGFRPEQTH